MKILNLEVKRGSGVNSGNDAEWTGGRTGRHTIAGLEMPSRQCTVVRDKTVQEDLASE